MPAATTNAYINGLLGDWKWAVKDLTFRFPTSASFYGFGYGNGEPLNGFAVLNAAQQAATRAALDQFSSVANVTFTEITESATTHADLRSGLHRRTLQTSPGPISLRLRQKAATPGLTAHLATS
ncbi:hypothetical protein QN222_18610 [Sinorhizobium sp. 6-70]|nr:MULTISPECIES: hypothetical protein [unclassified Sinorhizobium]MDK1376497.1 hypothetical protein [Sinorhizobium sp. 6-70]MDK1481948.1 hypothetical protein [Sinorhizobium sp. 6-117]